MLPNRIVNIRRAVQDVESILGGEEDQNIPKNDALWNERYSCQQYRKR
jgi:hypothetical protein